MRHCALAARWEREHASRSRRRPADSICAIAPSCASWRRSRATTSRSRSPWSTPTTRRHPSRATATTASARYLDGLLRGELIGAVSLTEPAAGSDFPAIRTRAERVAGGWRLNGEKAWLTNGAAVDVIVVYAQTDASAGGKGIAAFVVDARRAGFERGPAYGLAGAHALGAAGFKLTDYFAADEDLFYAPGTAFKTALASITGARIYVAAMCCGMVEEALTLALARSSVGESLIKRQGLRWMLADAATDLEAARPLSYRAARLLEAGEDAVLAAAHAKKFATRMAEQRLPQCMQVFGAEGLMDAHPLGRHLAAARVAHYADGTTEIQNERIAAYLGRGLPGES